MTKATKQDNAEFTAHCPMEVEELSIYTQKYDECE
jgi:hypothetical protein